LLRKQKILYSGSARFEYRLLGGRLEAGTQNEYRSAQPCGVTRLDRRNVRNAIDTARRGRYYRDATPGSEQQTAITRTWFSTDRSCCLVWIRGFSCSELNHKITRKNTKEAKNTNNA
jgi:hypothetical protein